MKSKIVFEQMGGPDPKSIQYRVIELHGRLEPYIHKNLTAHEAKCYIESRNCTVKIVPAKKH